MTPRQSLKEKAEVILSILNSGDEAYEYWINDHWAVEKVSMLSLSITRPLRRYFPRKKESELARNLREVADIVDMGLEWVGERTLHSGETQRISSIPSGISSGSRLSVMDALSLGYRVSRVSTDNAIGLSKPFLPDIEHRGA